MIINNKIILREKRLADARKDYQWEKDPELAYLDAAPVLSMTFSQYLPDYTYELKNPVPSAYRFAIETLEDNKHIGNCSYYNIDERKREAELGIMIGDRDYWDRGYGVATVTALVDYIFRETKLTRIYLKTLESNNRAQKCFQKCGFTPYNRLAKDGYRFLLMQIDRNEWLARKPETT